MEYTLSNKKSVAYKCRQPEYAYNTLVEQTKLNDNDEKPRVLLVEDNQVIQIINVTLLQQLGCDVTLAKTGEDALTLSHNDYDVILLDINLPGMSGIDVCKKMREEPRLSETPIIAVTAISVVVEEECMEAGMSEVACKPLLREGLYDILTRWLKNDKDKLLIHPDTYNVND